MTTAPDTSSVLRFLTVRVIRHHNFCLRVHMLQLDSDCMCIWNMQPWASVVVQVHVELSDTVHTNLLAHSLKVHAKP